jgi:hypothetical protein
VIGDFRGGHLSLCSTTAPLRCGLNFGHAGLLARVFAIPDSRGVQHWQDLTGRDHKAFT